MWGAWFSETWLGPAFRVHGSSISRHGPSEGPQGQNRDTDQGISIGIPIVISRGVPLRRGWPPWGEDLYTLFKSWIYRDKHLYVYVGSKLGPTWFFASWGTHYWVEGSEPGHQRQREQGAWSPHSEKHSLGRPGNFSRALGGLPQGGIPAFDSRALMTWV